MTAGSRGSAAGRLRARLLLLVAVLAAGAAALVMSEAVLRSVELASVDARFELRGELPPPPELLVVAVDDVTFSDLPDERWPFDRRLFARVLERVAEGGARVIVYDVQFTEPQGDRPADVRADNALIEAARAAGNVVLSSTEVADGGRTRVFGGVEAQRYARAAVGNGLAPEDPDGRLRRVRYAIDGLRSLPVAAVERMGRRVDRAALAGEGAWIDYAGPAGHLETVSFSRVLTGRVAAERFRDRIVVIGASAPVLHDRHPVPMGDERMAGAEVHANAIWTLLRGVPLRSAPDRLGWLLALGLALAVPLAALRLRLVAALGLGALLAGGYAVAAHLAFDGGRILPLVAPLLGLAVGTAGTVGVHALVESVERARVRELFARFVPDPVVDRLLAGTGRADPRIGGSRLTCTVMFSDLRGFTRFAEGRDPEEVIEVLNRHLTLVSDAVLDHGGTLVTYMGDGVMAVFGAPLPADDHADRALAAARAMLAGLEELNRWMAARGWGEGFRMGIGLNAGPVMSGNVGSARRVEYTAIGDTTNTAARLQSMTKGTDHELFVADAVRAALREPAPDLVAVGELEVPGRSAPVRVWTVARRDGGGATR